MPVPHQGEGRSDESSADAPQRAPICLMENTSGCRCRGVTRERICELAGVVGLKRRADQRAPECDEPEVPGCNACAAAAHSRTMIWDACIGL